jgi:hypothetical protein
MFYLQVETFGFREMPVISDLPSVNGARDKSIADH